MVGPPLGRSGVRTSRRRSREMLADAGSDVGESGAQGLAAGPILVASLALLRAAFTDDGVRTRAVGPSTAIGTIGTALGPPVGGMLLFTLAGISLAAFTRRELRRADPMMDLRLFENAGYTIALISLFVFLFSLYGSLLIVTQFLQNVRDYSAIDTGVLIFPFAIGVMSMALEAAGLAMIALGLSWSIWLVPAGLLVSAWGNTLGIVPLTGLSMSTVPAERAGMASGVMSTQRAIGSTTGMR